MLMPEVMIAPRRKRNPRRTVVLSLIAPVAAFAMLLTGCTGGVGQQTDPNAPVTITFWHGWSLPNDLAALGKNIDQFEKLHPNITVKTTPNVSDDKILQGLRSANGPDVASSFVTDAVGALCNGALIDLNPLLEKDGIDKDATFIPSRIGYTQFDGKQCALPLLGDAFGLYYNTDMFAAAGITAPPKTWSEFTDDAVKLTKMKGDTYEQLGFMASVDGYESNVSTWMHQWSPTYFDAQGESNLANDPKVSEFFEYTTSLIDALGGYTSLQKYRSTFGDEWSAENPFEVGKVAMAFDGEWRIPIIKDDGAKVNYAVAPLPVPDDQVDSYGKGFLTGTIVGIASKSRSQQAAWEFVKYLTTNEEALVSFGNTISNLPSTLSALESSDLPQDAAFQTFLDISANPNSLGAPATANGNEYLTVLHRFAAKWESGEVTDLRKGLADADKQIDAATAQTGK